MEGKTGSPDPAFFFLKKKSILNLFFDDFMHVSWPYLFISLPQTPPTCFPTFCPLLSIFITHWVEFSCVDAHGCGPSSRAWVVYQWTHSQRKNIFPSIPNSSSASIGASCVSLPPMLECWLTWSHAAIHMLRFKCEMSPITHLNTFPQMVAPVGKVIAGSRSLRAGHEVL